jgi:hypothetical protein
VSERTCSKWVNRCRVEGGNLHTAVKAHHYNGAAARCSPRAVCSQFTGCGQTSHTSATRSQADVPTDHLEQWMSGQLDRL